MNNIFRKIREPFCGMSHMAGALLSIAALVVLLIVARGRVWPLVGVGIYGLSLIVLYTASALYHSHQGGPKVHDRLGRFDYIAIFLLIAGSYAPLCLVTLHGAWGWGLLGAEYGVAMIGAGCILLWDRMPDWLRWALYVCAGLLLFVAWPQLKALLPMSGLAWLVGGGLVYLVGAAVLATERAKIWRTRNNAHSLWHVFVLAGSACHFVFVLCFIAMPG